jgi:outer membrane protein assembly factor BamB
VSHVRPRRRAAYTDFVYAPLAWLAVLGALAGCGSLTSVSTPTRDAADLFFALDSNAMSAKSLHDIQNSVVALGAHDGHLAWRRLLEAPAPTDQTIATLQPFSQDGLVFISYVYEDTQTGVRHGVVETFDPATGATRWRREVASEIVSEPVVSGAVLYVSAAVFAVGSGSPPPESGLVEALDSQTGAVLWRRALDATPLPPTVVNGQVFVMTSQQFGGHVLALSASDGSIIWDYASDAPVSIGGDTENGGSTAPLVRNNLVYVQATDRDPSGGANLALLALNTRDGSVAWQYQTGGIAATPAFNQAGDTLCVSAGVTPNTSVVVGLAATSGHVRWRLTDTGGLSGCTLGGDAFYLTEGSASQPGSVLALNSQDGRLLWKVATNSPVVDDGLLAPTVAPGGLVGVYLTGPATTSGMPVWRMAMLRASDGALVWQRDFQGRPEHLMEIAGSQIYNDEFAVDAGSIVAYGLDSGARLWTYRLGYL